MSESSSDTEDQLMQTMTGNSLADSDSGPGGEGRPRCPSPCQYPVGLVVRVVAEDLMRQLGEPFFNEAMLRFCGQRGVVVRHSGDLTLVHMQRASSESPAIIECHTFHRACLARDTPAPGRQRRRSTAAAGTPSAAAAAAATAAHAAAHGSTLAAPPV